MTLDLSNEAILKQLGFTNINNALLNQVSSIREATNKFEAIEKHIFDLHKSLEKVNGYVTLSNSKNYLKIKHQHDSSETRIQESEFSEIVKAWAERYKIALENVNSSTYYILGLNH
jgi:hypothetical protein